MKRLRRLMLVLIVLVLSALALREVRAGETGTAPRSSVSAERTRAPGVAVTSGPRREAQDYARREASSRDLENFVGGSNAVLIVALALILAAVLIIGLIIPW
jgi:hypothetical protein